MRLIPADRLHPGQAAIAVGGDQQFLQRAAVVFREREGRAKDIFASELPVGQDLHRIVVSNTKQDAANLDSPVRESMEAIDSGKAQLLHHRPGVGDPDRAIAGLPNVEFLIQDRGIDDTRDLSSPSL